MKVWGINAAVLAYIEVIQLFCLVYDRSFAHCLSIVVYEDIGAYCENPAFEIDIVTYLSSLSRAFERGVRSRSSLLHDWCKLVGQNSTSFPGGLTNVS